MKHKAFLYRNEYYLLPDGFDGVEELPMDGFTAVWLQTERCTPPDFVWEDTKEIFLVLRAPTFLTTVNVYSREEYDERLRRNVLDRCGDCVRFSGDADDLSGHYCEMSLDGVCYLKETKEDAPAFSLQMFSALEKLAEISAELASCVDAADEAAFQKLVSDAFSEFFLPVEAYGGVDGDKYCICLSGNLFSVEGFSVILKTFSELASTPASPLYKKGWRVYPYLPKEVFKPALSPNYFKKPPALYILSNAETGDFEIDVYQKGANEWSDALAEKRNVALYKYLCSTVGENLLLAGTSRIRIVGEPPIGGELVDAAELFKRLEAYVWEIYRGVPYPAPFYLRPSGDYGVSYPYKEELESWITVCPEMPPSMDETDFEEDPMRALLLAVTGRETFDVVGLGYIYIYFPYDEEGEYDKKQEFLSAFSELVSRFPFGGAEIAKNVGSVRTAHGECEDFMVFDERAFFDVVRYLSPMLKGMEAKIVSVKADGAIVYEPDFEIRPTDAELYS